MIPTPNSFTDMDDWINQLDFNHILSLLKYSQSDASNVEKRHINKTLTNLLYNLPIIKKYYETHKRTPEQTMFDNIICPYTKFKPRSKQRYKPRIIEKNINGLYQNCGRSQCEMLFNGCSHSD